MTPRKQKFPITIELRGLRVEFDGLHGPTRLIVPLLFLPAKHRDIAIRIKPRSGVSLKNEVDVGDAFKQTFSRSQSGSFGGSFFAAISYQRTAGLTNKAYEVVHLPDFKGILFRLASFDVRDEPVGVQLSFPVESCELSSDADYFATIRLERAGSVLQEAQVPREVHPMAGRILLLDGYASSKSAPRYLGAGIAAARGPFLQVSPLTTLMRDNIETLLEESWDGIHLYVNVRFDGKILVNDEYIGATEFLTLLTGYKLKFLFVATCNSVNVVSAFRRTDIGALVAATTNLWFDYITLFEERFYTSLAQGEYLSSAFRSASVFDAKVTNNPLAYFFINSGAYDPMFLDLRRDCRFGAP